MNNVGSVCEQLRKHDQRDIKLERYGCKHQE